MLSCSATGQSIVIGIRSVGVDSKPLGVLEVLGILVMSHSRSGQVFIVGARQVLATSVGTELEN